MSPCPFTPSGRRIVWGYCTIMFMEICKHMYSFCNFCFSGHIWQEYYSKFRLLSTTKMQIQYSPDNPKTAKFKTPILKKYFVGLKHFWTEKCEENKFFLETFLHFLLIYYIDPDTAHHNLLFTFDHSYAKVQFILTLWIQNVLLFVFDTSYACKTNI